MSNTVKLVIDQRERELCKLLEEQVSNLCIETLDVGDIIFRTEEEILLVIERKTIQDLKASVCDGRAREQKARLLSTFPKSRIIYLIEGNLNQNLDSKLQGMPISTLIGSLINTQLRDGIKVYKTQTINETVNFLIKLEDKLEKDKDKYFNEEDHQITAAEYSATLKKKKKSCMTPEVWFITLLASIPQVTEKIAEEIMKVYPTIVSLVKAYEKTLESNRAGLLANLTYPLCTGKTRRIGDKVSRRIYMFFYDISDSVKDEVEVE